ncbi:fibronectin type III domain-containing protein [Actinoplanes sp. L3-i22]|uniref:fibronectin type III domain-containing protein n=1 Tax=Actinoplanes sp. L3-i22 TaxID=2836373 RepID=UPI001C75BA3D|nr:fibronectin type III domain-containing protein [Actinoplanes sp. L3-i22]BCY11557.1 hypothetical protein L3i22_066450 [Actinoplanes sp. L3-i22]
MHLRRIVLSAAAGAALLATGACGTSTATPAAAASPAPLSAAWYAGGAAPAPSVAPAQVAPGAYHPVAVSTGQYLAVSPAATRTTVPASVAATANCSPALGPATTVPVTATAGTGTITARWTELSDPAVLTYRVAAIPDYGPPTRWLTVAATHTCNPMSVAITGLTKGAHYQVWVDAVHTGTTYGTSGVVLETMIGRSLTVTVN